MKNFNLADGAYPGGSLIKAADGNFYGLTTYGGTSGVGTIFKMTPSGTFTVIKHLDNTTGNYTHGDVTQSSWWIQGDLVEGTGGVLYGMTYKGGTYNGGTIFKVTTSGTFTVLRHLNPLTDGMNPKGSLSIQLNTTPTTPTTPTKPPKNIKFTVSIYPNPTKTYFSLQTTSGSTQPISLRVTDVLGRIVETRYNIVPNSTITFGSNYVKGTYYAEVIQGNEKKTVKLMKK